MGKWVLPEKWRPPQLFGTQEYGGFNLFGPFSDIGVQNSRCFSGNGSTHQVVSDDINTP